MALSVIPPNVIPLWNQTSSALLKTAGEILPPRYQKTVTSFIIGHANPTEAMEAIEVILRNPRLKSLLLGCSFPLPYNRFSRPKHLRCPSTTNTPTFRIQELTEALRSALESRKFEDVLTLGGELQALETVHFGAVTAQTLSFLGRAHRKTQNFTEALALLDHSLDIREDAFTLYEIGIVFRHLDRLEDSASALRDTLVFDDKNPKYLCALAITLRKIGDPESLQESVGLLHQAIALCREDRRSSYIFEYGMTLRRMSLLEEAEKKFRECIVLSADNIEHKNVSKFLLASTLRDLERMHEAYDLLMEITFDAPSVERYQNVLSDVSRLMRKRFDLKASLNRIQKHQDENHPGRAENLLRELNLDLQKEKFVSPLILSDLLHQLLQTGRQDGAVKILEESLLALPYWMDKGDSDLCNTWKELLLKLREPGLKGIKPILKKLRNAERSSLRLISSLPEDELLRSPVFQRNDVVFQWTGTPINLSSSHVG